MKKSELKQLIRECINEYALDTLTPKEAEVLQNPPEVIDDKYFEYVLDKSKELHSNRLEKFAKETLAPNIGHSTSLVMPVDRFTRVNPGEKKDDKGDDVPIKIDTDGIPTGFENEPVGFGDFGKDVGYDYSAEDEQDKKDSARNALPIIKAVRADDIEATKYFLDNGGNVNEKDKLLQTPLHWAASTGNVEIVNLLLKCGADKNAKDYVHKTPLDNAKIMQNAEIIDILKK